MDQEIIDAIEAQTAVVVEMQATIESVEYLAACVLTVVCLQWGAQLWQGVLFSKNSSRFW